MEPNRVAVVTGAAGGLSTAIAAGLGQAGFRLALLHRAALVPAAAMAAPVAWLCSDAADAVTGRRLVASGWVDPPASAAPATVGTDRNVPMAGTPARPARS